MRVSEVVRLAFESLFAHKFRAALTMLGLVIGVFAVVTLVSLGQGAKRYVLNEFQSLGTNLIIIQPGRTDERNKFGPPAGNTARKMTVRDVEALERKAVNIQAVTGLILASGTIKFEEAVSSIRVFGSNEQFPQILSMPVGDGSFFSKEEHDSGRRVVVLGGEVKRDLFGEESAIGRTVKLNNSEFRVVGVLAKVGEKLGFNLDEFALIPTNAALRLFNEDKLFGIRAKASARVTLQDAIDEVTEILKDRRNGEEDFTIITQASAMESLDRLLSMLSYMLGGIASISMLVGGIGIMNIMLVSVSERTSEIGIRRAVGAKRTDILKQFLTEAIVLSLIGGAIGIAASMLVAQGLHFAYPSFDMRPTASVILPAFGISALIGVLFGVWPAARAARIETLDALRHE